MIRVFRHYISGIFLVLFLIESGIFYTSFFFGDILRDFSRNQLFFISENIWDPSIVYSLVMLVCAIGMGFYQRRTKGISDMAMLLRIGATFMLGWAAVSFAFYVFPLLFPWRRIIPYALSVSMAGILVSRFLFFKFADKQMLNRRILVLGAGYRGNMIREFEKQFAQRAFRIIGYVRMGDEPLRIEPEVLIDVRTSLFEFLTAEDIDEIVVAPDDRGGEIKVDEILECKMAGFEVVDLLTFFEREAGMLRVDCLRASWLVFSDGFHHSGVSQVFKRWFDVVASVSLLAVVWPVILLTALVILIESGWRAPVLYRQMRVGLNGRQFRIVKFRSMRTDAEKDGMAQWAKVKDGRVTRVGAFIRKVRIDELPQLINVLKGEMSFVGPRPERPEFVEQFAGTIPYYSQRHRVKPGITGWAQLCHCYTDSYQGAIEKLQYDLYYIKNYSIFLDMVIILQTIEIVLWGKGL